MILVMDPGTLPGSHSREGNVLYVRSAGGEFNRWVDKLTQGRMIVAECESHRFVL